MGAGGFGPTQPQALGQSEAELLAKAVQKARALATLLAAASAAFRGAPGSDAHDAHQLRHRKAPARSGEDEYNREARVGVEAQVSMKLVRSRTDSYISVEITIGYDVAAAS